MRGSSFRTIATLIAVPLAGMAIFFFWQWIHDGITPAEVAREVPRALKGERRRAAEQNAGGAAAPQEPAAPLEKGRPRKAPRPLRTDGPLTGEIVLIIDDLGFEGQPLDRVMALDPNVNCSILPNGPRAGELAGELDRRGFEILCHLPMEPRGTESPGPNAIMTTMSDAGIARATAENLAAVPHARGVNNHMGSLATSDRRVMEAVLHALPRGLYFIDSRTSGRSVAGKVARELGIPTATRHVFLDNDASEPAIRRQLAELAATADARGLAIGIGHPYPATIRVLEREIPALRARGVRFVRASQAIPGSHSRPSEIGVSGLTREPAPQP